MAQVPKRQGFASTIHDSGVANATKTEVIKDAGFTPKQAERFQTLARNKDIVEQAKAEENILATQNNDNASAYQKSEKQINTAKELAKVAGVSHDTIAKVMLLLSLLLCGE